MAAHGSILNFGVGGSKVSSCVNLGRIKLEIWNFLCECTHIYSLRKYTFWYQDSFTFANVNSFSQKNVFREKQYPFTIQQYESWVANILVLFSLFVRKGIIINESFRVHMSGICLHVYLKLAKNKKNVSDIRGCWLGIIDTFYCCRVSLVKFSYWSKFDVIIVTGSGVDNFCWEGIDQRSGNPKYPWLSVALYLEF